MFEADNIRDWRGRDVIDPGGSKIGQLEAIYVSTTDDLPAFATVRVGIIGRYRLAFVPLHDATVGPGYVRVRSPKKLVKDAPSIATDGELEATAEPAVFEHYGLAYTSGSIGERRLARR